MKVKANGTHAKDIALHFVKLTDMRVTSHIMGKTIQQAKSLLEHGYAKEEIVKVLDFLILTKKANIYSLGYVSASINDVLREMEQIKAEEEAELAKEELRKMTHQEVTSKSEVSADGESAERNRQKAKRINPKSRYEDKWKNLFN